MEQQLFIAVDQWTGGGCGVIRNPMMEMGVSRKTSKTCNEAKEKVFKDAEAVSAGSTILSPVVQWKKGIRL
jgi:hypothetical protein